MGTIKYLLNSLKKSEEFFDITLSTRKTDSMDFELK